jgi:hypothetical protein
VEKFELLYQVLVDFDKTGILKDLVLVGSWCQDFYRMQFGQPASIPAARTMDADILIPRGLRVSPPVDITAILEGRDFVVTTDHPSGLQRFVHPQLDVEFLTNAKAGPEESIHRFKDLCVTAQELRFMTIPLQYHCQVHYRDLTINIPEPEAYALHKLLVSARRKNPVKKTKDLEAVRGLFTYFEKHSVHIRRLQTIYSALPKAWQRRLNGILKKADLILPGSGLKA